MFWIYDGYRGWHLSETYETREAAEGAKTKLLEANPGHKPIWYQIKRSNEKAA